MDRNSNCKLNDLLCRSQTISLSGKHLSWSERESISIVPFKSIVCVDVLCHSTRRLVSPHNIVAVFFFFLQLPFRYGFYKNFCCVGDVVSSVSLMNMLNGRGWGQANMSTNSSNFYWLLEEWVLSWLQQRYFRRMGDLVGEKKKLMGSSYLNCVLIIICLFVIIITVKWLCPFFNGLHA